jgi:hypothetical protein
MDCNSFERINTMQWIWANAKQNFPHSPPKILVPLQQINIFLVAIQRTSEVLGLGRSIF